MNAQNNITAPGAADAAPLLEQAEVIAGQSQQVVEAVKSALLLADEAALFGAALANRVNAGALEGWNRTPPEVSDGFAALDAARSLLNGIQEALSALQDAAEAEARGRKEAV